MKLGIVIYSNDAETVWNAFRFANFSLKEGDTVKIFLLAKGVEYEKLDSEKFFELKPQKNDFIVAKNTYDAFTNPKLGNLLKKQKIKYVAVAGVFGDGCVESTIQGGFSAGFNFIILKDLIETTDVEMRQKLQKLLKEYTWPTMIGKTINSKSFFDYVE